MKKLIIAAALTASASTATAGSYAPPIVEPEIIIEDTVGSTSHQWLVPVTLVFLLLLSSK